MEHNSNDVCDISDSKTELCSEKPKSNEIDMKAPSLGETQSKGVSDGTLSSLMLEGEDKRDQAIQDAGSLMVHNSDDECDINDSEIKLCSEKPESHENVMRVPSLGETQYKGVGGGTMSSSLMLKGKELEDKREQAVYDAGIMMEVSSDDECDIRYSKIRCIEKPKSNEIDMKVQKLGETQSKGICDETMSSSWMIGEKDKRERAFYDAEIWKMERIAQDYVTRVVQEQEKINHELETERINLDWITWALDKPHVFSKIELKKLVEREQQHITRIDSLSKASMEQKKAHESVLRLTKEQKKEKVEALKMILQLEAKHKLQLKIEVLKGKIEVVKNLGDGEAETLGKIMDMTEELKQEDRNLNNLETLMESSFQSKAQQNWQDNQKKIQQLRSKLEQMSKLRDTDRHALAVLQGLYRETYEVSTQLGKQNRTLKSKLQQSNEELLEARRVTTECLMNMPPKYCSIIGVKRVGEIDKSAFVLESEEKKLSKRIAAAEKKCSLLQDMISDSAWRPFKTIKVDGMSKEVVNQLDEKLVKLKNESSQAVYDAVIVALQEIIEYNPSEKKVMDELWNFEQGRKAKLVEGVDQIAQYLNKRCVRKLTHLST